MVLFGLRVAAQLAAHGVEAEVIDLRSVSPFDSETDCKLVEKTGRLAVLDSTWASFGMVAEVIERVAEHHGRRMRADPARIIHPDDHTRMSSALEAVYYPNEEEVVKKLLALPA